MISSLAYCLHPNRLVFLSTLLGALAAPNNLFATTYTLALSYFDETTATIALMTDDMTIAGYEELSVAYQTWHVSATPNGQAVIFGARSSHPKYTAAFLSQDHRIRRLDTRDLDNKKNAGPIACHQTLPLFYGGQSVCRAFQIDYGEMRIGDIISTGSLYHPPEVDAHSSAWNVLVYRDELDPFFVMHRTDAGGRLTGESMELRCDPRGANVDLVLSPNGQFVTTLANVVPQLSVIRIDGPTSPVLVKQYKLPESEFWYVRNIRYTPDGTKLLLTSWMADTTRRVSCFLVDRKTGEVTLGGSAGGAKWDYAQLLEITPDGRYALILSPDIPVGDQMVTVMHVVRIHDDGSLEWVEDRDFLVYGYPADMKFVPPWSESYPNAPNGVVAY